MPKILAMSSTSVIDVQDGNSVAETIVEYAVSSSGTIPPGAPFTDKDGNVITDINGIVLTQGNWSTELPNVADGEWLWTRTRTVYSDGKFAIIYNVSRSGVDGAPGERGVGVTTYKEQWYLSSSPTAVAGGSWSYDEPDEIPSGKYLWGRYEITLTDGNVTYSDAVHRSTISGLINLADEVNKKITQKIWQDDINSSINAYDGTTGADIRSRVSQTEQDITGITSTVSDISSELSTKADGEEFKTLQNTVTQNKQTADSFQQTVTSTYAKLSDVDKVINNIKIGGNNLYVIADEAPGYIHASSGAVVAPNPTTNERTSQFIPVKEGESYVIQSWATPTTDDGESWLAYQYYSNNTGTPVGGRVGKYGKTSGSGVETTADGQEHLTYKITIPEGVKYLRVSYRHFDDGYAMVEKATTASEYAINPRDLEKYADDVVNTAKTEIKQTTDSISLSVASKVGADEIISKINLSKEDATIQASKVDLIGNVTFNMLDTTTQSRIDTIETTANSASASATLANDKADQGLAMKINYSAFSTFNNGECYIHGFNEDNEPADVDGYIYYKGRKITVAKKMIDPNTICPYYKTIYLVLRLPSVTATSGDLYLVWYDSGWKYGETPTPTVANTWSWIENRDIVIGQFVEPHSEGAMVDARLYNPPKSPYEVITTLDNAYGYAYGVVNWVGNNGTSLTNALSMIKKWTDGAVSDTTTIQGGWIATNTITSNQLATDAIMSNNYRASSNLSSPYSLNGTFLDLTNGNFWTPNFGVIQVAPQGTTVQPGAWFNGTVYGTAGRFGEGSSYWSIEQVEDYNIGTHAALVGTGNPYLQTGNWQINDNAIQTRKYTSTAEYSGESTYYKDTSTNTYYDVGMKIPTDFSARSSTDSAVTTYNKSFFYGRKYTGNDIPTMDSEWTYFFQVDNEGNIYEQGQPLNKRYAAIGDVEGQYISTTGGIVNGNLTVTGTLNATANVAKKVTNALSINGQSFDGSAAVTVGTIGVGYGGTGKTSWTQWGIVYASATNALSQITAGTSGQLLKSNGNAAPTWVNQSSITAGSAINDADGNAIKTTYRKLDNNDFDTINTVELNAGNLVVTGAGRFTNGLYGDLTGNITGGSTKVFDSGNGTATTFAYSKSGLTANWTATPWFAAWDGYELRAISAANVKTTLGLSNVDNTADANKSVNYANSAGSATKATQDGDGNTINSTYLKLSGGTMTGELISQSGGIWVQGNSAAGGNYNRLSLTSGMPTELKYNGSKRGTRIYSNGIAFADPYNGNTNNDSGWIRHVEETANSGFLEIAVGDDSNEAIVVRQYNTSSAVAREAYLLNSSGNTSFPGTVTATTFSGKLNSRTITVGKTAKAIDWSGNVSWSIAEIADNATTSAQGWMSPEDKSKLDSITVTSGGTIEANNIVGSNGISVTLDKSTGIATVKHANSAITAGTASGTATGTLTNGGSFNIPTVTYDAYGHITTKGTTTLTLPNITSVTGNAGTATKFASNQSVTLTGDTTGSASSQAGWSIATTTKLFTGTLEADPAMITHPGDGKIRFSYNVSNPTGIFARTDNSNAIITINRHGGNYDSQIGFSSNGYIYYRSFSAKALDNTTAWKTMIDSDNYTSYTVKKDGTGASGTWGISISGNATTATTASSVSGVAGTTNADRHVWFSDSTAETYRNYDDDFKYNPSTNTLTVANVAGTATKATQDGDGNTISSTYAKLSGATFTGAVTGTYYLSTTKMTVTGGKVTEISTAPRGGLFADGVAFSNPATRNDEGWIRVLGTGETDTVLEIATGDDGGSGEQIKARQYNTSNAVVHEMTLLDAAGNTAVPGSLTIGSGTTDAANTVKLVMNKTLGCLDFVFN